MKLTPTDLEQFAQAGRHALAQLYGQFKQMQPKFRTVTAEAVGAMKVRIVADPTVTPATPGIDHAVYFAALFLIIAENMESDIKALAHAPDVTTLHALFQRSYSAAGAINALTLLGQGGLMPQLHLEERAPIIVAQRNANKRHAAMNAAKAWVKAQWDAKGATEYENNKSQFAKTYEDLVPAQFPDVTVTRKVIRDRWLR